MKGLISNQNGPKLEEILRLLAQSDAPTHIALRGFGHPTTATVSLRDGRILNATSGGLSGEGALRQLLEHDSWHFESFPELQSTREDFAEQLEVTIHIVGLRASLQAQRATQELDQRKNHPFSMVDGHATGELSDKESKRLDEEFTFLHYYAQELGSALSLGVSKAIAYSDVDRAMAVKARGDQWEGVFCNRSASLAQLLTEVA